MKDYPDKKIIMGKEQIHINIKNLREANHLTQKKVADLLSIPLSNYGKYEEGRAKPPLETIDAICDLYNVTFKQLIGSETITIEKQFKARYSTAPAHIREAIDLLLM